MATFEQFRRDFLADPENPEKGRAYASAILRRDGIPGYEKYEEWAHAINYGPDFEVEGYNPEDLEEAYWIINYLRAIVYPEAAFALEHTEFASYGRAWIFEDLRRQEQSAYMYINASCHGEPIASLRAMNWAQLKDILDWLRSYLKILPTLKLPPDPVEVINFQSQKYIFAFNYNKKPCKPSDIKISTDYEPLFDFSPLRNVPVRPWKKGQRDGQMRPITEDDLSDGDDYQYTGEEYILYEYDDLPNFSRPTKETEPYYVVAGETYRTGSQYGGWTNITNPFSIIYIGYIENYLLTNYDDEYHWQWRGELTRKYTCYSGHETTEDDIRRCPICQEDWADIEVVDAPGIFIDPEKPKTPKPPAQINAALRFMHDIYDQVNEGNIYSVLGGTQLSVYLESGYYGIEDTTS